MFLQGDNNDRRDIRPLYAIAEICQREDPMTRTWLQWVMQQNDTDLLSYDFAQSCPTWEAWWFRVGIAAAGITLAWLFFH